MRLSQNAVMDDLTGFQRDTLYVLAGLDSPHGFVIRDELEDYYDKDVDGGRLYPNLDTLVNKRLVEKEEYDKRTNSYTLTERGRRALNAHHDWKAQYISD